MVGGAEEPTTGVETGSGEFGEVAVVGFGTEDFSLVVAGEAWRVEDDSVEAASLFREATEPVEGVAFDEVMLLGIDGVESHVVAGPVEVRL